MLCQPTSISNFFWRMRNAPDVLGLQSEVVQNFRWVQRFCWTRGCRLSGLTIGRASFDNLYFVVVVIDIDDLHGFADSNNTFAVMYTSANSFDKSATIVRRIARTRRGACLPFLSFAVEGCIAVRIAVCTVMTSWMQHTIEKLLSLGSRCCRVTMSRRKLRKACLAYPRGWRPNIDFASFKLEL